MPTVEHGFIALNIGTAFKLYLKQNPVGIATVSSCHQMPNDASNECLPDVAVILGPEIPLVRKGAALFMPDLAVEIKSPDENLKQMREKAHYYLAHGTHLVWIVLPAQQIIEVYTASDEAILGIDGVLMGEPVLPRFSLPIKEVFEG